MPNITRLCSQIDTGQNQGPTLQKTHTHTLTLHGFAARSIHAAASFKEYVAVLWNHTPVNLWNRGVIVTLKQQTSRAMQAWHASSWRMEPFLEAQAYDGTHEPQPSWHDKAAPQIGILLPMDVQVTWKLPPIFSCWAMTQWRASMLPSKMFLVSFRLFQG